MSGAPQPGKMILSGTEVVGDPRDRDPIFTTITDFKGRNRQLIELSSCGVARMGKGTDPMPMGIGISLSDDGDVPSPIFIVILDPDFARLVGQRLIDAATNLEREADAQAAAALKKAAGQ